MGEGLAPNPWTYRHFDLGSNLEPAD